MLAAGALAGAVVALTSAWGVLFGRDPVDRVEITSVEHVGYQTLPQFAAGHGGTEAPLAPAGDAAGRVVLRPVADVDAGAAPADEVSPPPEEPDDPDDPDQPGDPTAPATDPAPAPSGPATDTPTDSPATQDPRAADTALRSTVERLLTDDPRLDGYRIPPDEVADWLVVPVVGVTPGTSVSPGTIASLEVEMRNDVVAAVESIETVEVAGLAEPLGLVVAVNFDVEGMATQQLQITWSLNGLDVVSQWTSEHFGYRATATTDRDRGAVELWVPDLEAPGTYAVDVAISRVSDGAVLTTDGLTLPNP
ncbi:hypothetical protein [Cellulomonas sp. Marseille-Q8402]